MGRKRTNTAEWFWAQFDRSDPGACWPWPGKPDLGGYGKVEFYGRKWWTSRLAMHLSGVAIAGLDVCHTCDNPPCCNPAHLFLGTAADNARDMVAKGRRRGPRGEAHHFSKLSADDASWIRSLSGLASIRGMARAFGVSPPAIRAVLDGRTWKEEEIRG